MTYKFFVDFLCVIYCNKVTYEKLVSRNHVFKWLVLYVDDIEIGRITLSESIKIKYQKESSSNDTKVYFVD